jgi:hypothetical protein
MTSKLRPRVTYGIAGPHGSDSPTVCGVCHAEIRPGDRYAAVLYEGSWAENGRREARCVEDCKDWSTTTADKMQVGDLLWTHRYQLTDWGPRIKAEVIHQDWNDTDERGWGAVWTAPAAPSDGSLIEKLRAIGGKGHEWAVRLADEVDHVDPMPHRVYMPGHELVHIKRLQEKS